MVKRGRVAIVGSKTLEKVLMPEFSKTFLSAVFFDPNTIKLTAGKELTATSNKFNLINFDYVLLLPDDSNKEFYYTLAKILEKHTKVSIPSDSLFGFWNRPILLSKISKAVPVRRTAAISQNAAADYIKNDFKLPVILTTPGGKRVYVSNEETLRNVLSLFSAGHLVSVHEPIKKAEVHVTFFSENSSIGYYRVGDKRVPNNLNSNLVEMGKRVRKVLNADFLSILFVKIDGNYYVSTIKLNPRFDLFNKVLGKDLVRIMASEISNKIVAPDAVAVADGFIKKLVRGMEKFGEWIGNEISNIRPSK
ncbi:MAG: hypothetical protein GOU98_02605 [Candidatus Altiarchaeota archaeon]|nr:hypothetical protein [Candidatus Altiarchaeota archaeon]